jgi:hypothetical protein
LGYLNGPTFCFACSGPPLPLKPVTLMLFVGLWWISWPIPMKFIAKGRPVTSQVLSNFRIKKIFLFVLIEKSQGFKTF